ncbi:hypothetical protein ACFY78_10710 [Streptomyces olindensis]|uniref:hypothetical protein n=1 Tax=Streptomyces olindensis TaxID=358823 RepID=UPI0036D1B1BB
MSASLALALAGLGLPESTSFGALLIPIWLLLTPGRVRAGRVAVYLATVEAFYFCVGVLLVLGADAVLEAVRAAFAGVAPTRLRIGQLVLGFLVIALSYRLEARARRRAGRPGRLQRWRAAAMSGAVPDGEGVDDGRGTRGAGVRGLMSLALVATALEVLTMVPYLAAVGLLANADLTWEVIGGALAGYCVMMILPEVLMALNAVIALLVQPA